MEPHYCVHKIPRPDYILCWMNQEIFTLHFKLIIALPSTPLFVMCSLPIIFLPTVFKFYQSRKECKRHVVTRNGKPFKAAIGHHVYR